MKSHHSGEMPNSPAALPQLAMGRRKRILRKSLGYSHPTPIRLGIHVSSLKVVPRRRGRPSSYGGDPPPLDD